MWLRKLISTTNDRMMRDMKRRPEHYQDRVRRIRSSSDLTVKVNGTIVVVMTITLAIGAFVQAVDSKERLMAVLVGTITVVGSIVFLKWLRTSSRRQLDRCERAIGNLSEQEKKTPDSPVSSDIDQTGSSEQRS